MARKVITVFGGSGMIGRLVARRYAKKGYEVRVAVRRPNQALFVRTYGEVGQVNPIQCNVRDDASTVLVMQGADIVVNAVSAPYENRFQNYKDIKRDAAERIARLAKEAGVKQLVHISGIGAEKDASSEYARMTAEGDEEVRKHFPNAIIVKPSIVFGSETDVFSKFAKTMRWSLIMPVIQAKTKLQPVYCDDVAEFIEFALENEKSGDFELGGDEIMTMRDIVDYVSKATCRKRIIFNMPRFMAVIMAWALQILQLITFGLFKNHVITPDQIKLLDHDNLVEGKNGLEMAGIVPENYQPILEPFMEAYRPQGEFEELVKDGI